MTLRSRLRCLRSQFVFPTVRLTFAGLRESEADFRVVHFSVQDNHLHLLVEASNKAALGAGLRGLAIRLALRVNRLLMRKGQVWADRSHHHTLKTPRAVRNALVYVLGNFRKHHVGRAVGLDPCSSAPYFDGYVQSIRVVPEGSRSERAPPGSRHERRAAPVASPRTWLLAIGWKRHGLLSANHGPRASRPS